ncbi:MAG: WcaI family glycosyltransferase [Cyclobacteriaceae bacterium]
MKILVYGINYAPELSGIGKYTSEMCEWLAADKQSVTVITANPYYPNWSVFEKFKNRYSKSKLNKVEVYRCPLYVPKRVSGTSRILHEISFSLSSSVVWFHFLLKPKFDFIICISPPFHLPMIAIMYRFLKGGKLIYHIQDLQIDAAKEMRIISSKRLLNWFFKFEFFLLNKMDLITSISKGMIKKIQSKSIESEINLFPNWVDINLIKPLPKNQSLIEKFRFKEDDFIILYSGNLGEKQGLDILMEAACHFVKRDHIKFLICGNGTYEGTLRRIIKEQSLANVYLNPLLPYNDLSRLLNTADVHLVLQKKVAADLVMPSKLTGIAASGGFSIVSAEPETTLYNTVKRHGLGILIEPESSKSLIRGIEESLRMSLEPFRKNARAFAENHLNKDIILRKFLEKLEKKNE